MQIYSRSCSSSHEVVRMRQFWRCFSCSGSHGCSSKWLIFRHLSIQRTQCSRLHLNWRVR